MTPRELGAHAEEVARRVNAHATPPRPGMVWVPMAAYLDAEGEPVVNGGWSDIEADARSKRREIKRRAAGGRPGAVYVLRGGEFCKIGFSVAGVRKRLAKLQTGCPYALEVVGEVLATSHLEREAQERFEDHRVHGEWFRVDPQEVLRWLQEHAP